MNCPWQGGVDDGPSMTGFPLSLSISISIIAIPHLHRFMYSFMVVLYTVHGHCYVVRPHYQRICFLFLFFFNVIMLNRLGRANQNLYTTCRRGCPAVPCAIALALNAPSPPPLAT